MGVRYFKICFCFSLHYLGNKLNSSPRVQSLLSARVIAELSLLDLISIHETLVIFPLPHTLEEGCDREALMSTWHPTRVNPLYWRTT